MKKRFLATLLCLLSLCTYGYAQKGQQSVGMNVSYNDNFSRNKGLGLGVKYHYYLSNYIRVSPTIKWVSMREVCDDYAYQGENHYTNTYYYQASYERVKTSGIDISVDFHWFFIPPYNRLRPYLITGVSCGFLKAERIDEYYRWRYKESIHDYEVIDNRYSESEKSKFALNYGIGLNWEVSTAISLQFEATRREEIGGSRDCYLINDDMRSFIYNQIAIGAVYNF